MAMQDGLDQQTNFEDSTVPPLTVNAQYLKDVTFENPNPVQAFQDSESNPEINVSIDIRVDKMGEKVYEVSLHVSAQATNGDKKLFIVEVDYAGVFTLGDLPVDAEHPVLMIECPRILFPYTRQIIANLTREGGFPALSLNPIDFVEMYRQQLARQEQESEPASTLIT